MAKRLLNTQRIVNLSADPASGTAGEIYYNTTSNTFKYYDGTAWVSLAGSGGLPSQSGNSGKYLTTNGTDPSWASVEALPSQTGNSGKYLTTNGTTASWSAVDADLLDGQHGSYYLDWTNATNKPDPTITLGGDLSGSITLTDLAGGTLTATINADSVVLGTDTTGNYVASVSGTDGVSISGTGEGASVTIANSDKGSSQNIFKNIAVSGQSDIVADSNNDTVTFAGGTGITLTTNDTTDTLTVTNSGVTSLSGTANQITASASTGSVTLSIPSSVVFPGTVTLNADPGQALEAATKQYVDAVAQGLHIHASAQTATTANIADLSSPPASIDGVTLTNNMRVLVKNQNTTSQNGVYVYSSSTGALTRASDFDTAIEIHGGDFIFVTGGSINNDTGWVQTETITTVGTDAILFQQFSGAGTYTAGNGLTLTGSQFSINTGVTVDLSTAQTLTNKTISGANNTLTVRLADDISGFGTGVASALAVNTGSAGAFVLFDGALGTPSSATLTNATGLPISTGVSGLGTGIATFLATPSSANLASAITDETGSGSLVFSTSPSLTTPSLGVASATSINKVTITAPATSATLTIADGKTLTASNTLTFTGTDASSVAFGAGGTVAYTASPTFTGTVILPTSASGGASIRIPHGTAPTSPTNGDIWTTTLGLFARINGTSQQYITSATIDNEELLIIAGAL